MGKEKKEKKKDREAGAASEADVTMDTTATEVRILQYRGGGGGRGEILSQTSVQYIFVQARYSTLYSETALKLQQHRLIAAFCICAYGTYGDQG